MCVPPSVSRYSSELSPPHIRGKLATTNQMWVCVGVLLGYVVDKYITNWRFALASGIPIAVLLCLCFLIVTPRSPRWLVKKGRYGTEHDLMCLHTRVRT